MMTVPPKIAIILPCFNEESVLGLTLPVMRSYLKDIKAAEICHRDSFLLFVDDGSTDNTWEIIRDSEGASLRGLKLFGNAGHQNALLAGMEAVYPTVDCCVTIDADLQDDYTKISEMIAFYNAGFQIVYGVRDNRKEDTFYKSFTATLFYRVFDLMGSKIVYNHADFRLLSSPAAKALLSYQERNVFLRGIVPTLGLKEEKVFYARKKRLKGESKYPTKKMVEFALNGVTSFSIAPIRLFALVGFLTMFTSFALGLWVLFTYLFGNTVPGWSSTLLPILFFGGLNLLTLGVIGEYVGKIYIETKARPRYIIEGKTWGEEKPEADSLAS
jgi:polyisoprenyl-phosphate glycosyltransferase